MRVKRWETLRCHSLSNPSVVKSLSSNEAFFIRSLQTWFVDRLGRPKLSPQIKPTAPVVKTVKVCARCGHLFEIRNQKDQNRKQFVSWPRRPHASVSYIRTFGFVSDFGFWISIFGFGRVRRLPKVNLRPCCVLVHLSPVCLRSCDFSQIDHVARFDGRSRDSHQRNHQPADHSESGSTSTPPIESPLDLSSVAAQFNYASSRMLRANVTQSEF